MHAIAAHHGEEEPQTVEAFIVATADAISGARPGARREMVENYIKRLEALEGVANSFDGVEKSFAIQAGREVRILVSPDKIDDLAASRLARDVVKKIEETSGVSGPDQGHGDSRNPRRRLRPVTLTAQGGSCSLR